MQDADNSASESCTKCGFVEADTFEPLPRCPLNFRDILSTNIPLSDSQEAQVLAGRLPLQARLQGLNDEIAALQLRLSYLNSERAHVQHHFDNFIAVKHPIRSLPDEILCSIFLMLINERSGPKRYVAAEDYTEERQLWTITHVSNRWRQIAIGFPELWSTIRLADHHFDRDPSQGLVQRLGCQLERSASHPLRLSIDMRDSISEDNSLVQLLLLTCSRWQALELQMPLDAFRVLRPIRSSLSLLESIDIIAIFGGSPDEVGTRIRESALSDLFSTAPRLSSIGRDPEVISLCTLPWGQITIYNEVHVNISRPVIRDDLATLKRMQNLRLCSLVCYNLETDVSPTVNLPELEELRLIGDVDCVISLLPKLILPNLTRLSLFISAGMLLVDRMSSVLSQFTTIQHLLINEEVFPALDAPLPLPTTLPRLESLYLGRPQIITAELFSPLAASALMPFLKTIAFNTFLSYQPEQVSEVLDQVKVYRPNLLVTLNIPILGYYERFGWLLREDSDQDPRRYIV